MRVGVWMALALVLGILAGSCGVKSAPIVRPFDPCKHLIGKSGCPSKADQQ